MAGYGGQTIALDVAPTTFDISSPLKTAAELEQADVTRQGSQLANALTQTQIDAAGRTAKAQDIDLRTELIRNAIAHGTDADSWDRAMKQAMANGAPEAEQYIGRYTPILQQRLSDAYSPAPAAPSGTAAGGSPLSSAAGQNTDMDRAYANVPPAQMAATLQKLNLVSSALQSVRDQPTWDAAIADLEAKGIPEAKQFAGPFSPLRVQQLYGAIQHTQNYLQQRLLGSATGQPTPIVPRETKEVGGVLYSVDANGQNATPLTKPTPNYQVTPALDGYGRPIAIDKTTGLPPPTGNGLVDYTNRVTAAESGGNPSATNPRSTAAGGGQFVDGTWLALMKDTHPDLTKGKTNAEILAMRNNPALSADMIQTYARQNAADLQKAGLPVTSATLYLAHGFGSAGAERILQSDPSTPMEKLFPPVKGKPNPVISANPQYAGMTTGDVAKSFAGKVGNDPIDLSGGATPGSNVPGNAQVHGDAYLKSIPDPAMAAEVKAIVEGRMQQPTSFFLKTPQGQLLMRAAAQYDPNFDLTLYQSRVAAQSDLAKGTMGKNVTSFNTAIGHADRLDRAIDALGNSTYFPAVVNPARQAWLKQTDPTFQRALAEFDADKSALTEELTRAFKGSGGTLTELQGWEDKLSSAASPEALHAAVREAMELLGSRIQATGSQYNRAMRLTAAPTSLLTPQAQAAFARLTGSGGASGGAGPQGAPAKPPAPQIGAVVRGFRFLGGDPGTPASWKKVAGP